MYKKGFTLIELLVVIAIIGILSSIVVAGLSGAKASGRDAKRISDIKNIQLSLSLYYNDNTKYPYGLSTLVPGYVSALPKDPMGTDYFYTPLGLTTNCASGNVHAQKYHLGAMLEGSKLPDDNILPSALNGYSTCSGYEGFTFPGDSTDCVTSGSPDQCYDVTN